MSKERCLADIWENAQRRATRGVAGKVPLFSLPGVGDNPEIREAVEARMKELIDLLVQKSVPAWTDRNMWDLQGKLGMLIADIYDEFSEKIGEDRAAPAIRGMVRICIDASFDVTRKYATVPYPQDLIATLKGR